MKFTLNWLKEYLKTNATLQEICDKLTAIGLEVEQISDKSKELADFKIAQILDAKPHPDADKLRVCQVETGSGQLQIVCGAPNARAGINVVLAPVGSTIPTNGMKIKASKIRGVDSNGMLCSAAELGLSNDSEGIIEMPACNDNLAKSFVEIAGLNDPVIEVAITPNRGDCLGVYGIARDLAAAGLGTLEELNITEIKGEFVSPIKVTIDDEKACPLFIGRYFKGVKNGSSPEWLVKKLEAIGLRPISALVDITNYIAFEFGRPLHVYDAKKLKGNLVVKKAAGDEKFTALDDKEYQLQQGMIVVNDDSGTQALGGVIGGSLSGCDDNTTDVFLEIALFDSVQVADAGRKADIITDSRYRFERSVDPAFLNKAMHIASKMIIDLCGGSASEPVIAGVEPKWQRSVKFDFAKVQTLGGVTLDKSQAEKILKDLGFTVTGDNVQIPSWRPDINGEPDLVEEIIRIYGFDKIPTLSLPLDNKVASLSPSQQRVARTRRNLASRGMMEAITWSFMQSDKAALFGFDNDKLRLKNPISSDMDVMRPSMLGNLIDAVKRNADRGNPDLSLFEIGLVFKNPSPEGQIQAASGIRSGKNVDKNIFGTSRSVDVFDAKADLISGLDAAGAPVDNLQVSTNTPSYYHPGRSGALSLGKNILGYFGEIHPGVLKKLDISLPVVGFELFFHAIPEARKKQGTAKARLEISEFQHSTRDFAFLVNKDIAVGDILRIAKASDKNLIENISLFDIYEGDKIEQGKKSVAISVNIRAADHTLTEAELEAVSTKIIEAVGKNCGGILR